jgi:hypothetical protein
MGRRTLTHEPGANTTDISDWGSWRGDVEQRKGQELAIALPFHGRISTVIPWTELGAERGAVGGSRRTDGIV